MKKIKRILDLEEESSISVKQKKSSPITTNVSINSIRPRSPILDSVFSSLLSQKRKPEEQCPYPLTIDCLEEIFSHLIDDKLTLFSCILVNRLWLELCIPLLWNNPFDNLIHRKNQLRLISTYITCLPTQDKQKLLKFNSNNKENINSNNSYKDKKKKFPVITIRTQPFLKFNNNYNRRNSLISSQVSLNHEPLFFYPKYLKCLNYDNFDLAVKEYCYWNRPSLDEYKNLIFELLKNLVFNNSIILKHLKIRFIKTIELPLQTLQKRNCNNSIDTFTKLTALDLSYMYSSSEIDETIPQQIFNICSHLSIHSTHIQRLTIFMQKWNENEFKQHVCHSIFNLIESQKNLKYLSINEFWNIYHNKFDYFNQFYQILLQRTNDTLEYLQFYELSQFDLLLNILGELKKLKSLEIKKLIKPTNFFYNNPFKISNLVLSRFECNYNPFPINDDSIIIRSFISPIITFSNKSLKSLSLSKITKDLLSTITVHCPNITNLSLPIYPSLIPEFCALLISLPNLHSLTIKKSSHYRLLFTDIDSNNLATNLPHSLYYFKTNLFDNSGSLKYFLENCSVDVKLSVLEVYQQLIDDDTLKAVLNYKQKSGGKLREFRYSGNRIMFNAQTWESTKKILPNLVKVEWS